MKAPSVAPPEFRGRQVATKAASAQRGLDGLLVWSTGGLALDGSAIMPFNAWHLISQALPKIQFEPADDILLSLRKRKSPAEIEMMRHASSVGAALQNAMFKAVDVGRTDDDLVREAYEVC